MSAESQKNKREMKTTERICFETNKENCGASMM